ncbi:signal peptide peptidase SppA [Schleiferiaceae bacterium]|nr:signal peptide peptidase SppA [Schleiferiaceae bacterium]
MKSFFTTFLAVLTALITLSFLSVLLLFGLAASSNDGEPKINENSLLKINLSGELVERTSEDPFAELNAELLGQDISALGLNDLMLGLKKAAVDDNIEGILLEHGAFVAGYGMLEELGEYFIEFKKSGKPIYSYGEYYTQKGAYLAALSDTAILHPGGIMDIRGIGISSTYYKDFFDKFGIEPLVVRGTGNDFKSAVEPYIASEMSKENRLQLSNLTSQFWEFIGDAFENEKNISRATLDSCANNWVGMDADKAMDVGLVEQLGYREDVFEKLEDRYELVNWKDYASTLSKGSSRDRIAVIYANGTIGNGTGGENSIGTRNIIKALEKASDNERVKAIVLRVNSPGGSALTSDMIHHAIDKVEKPIIVSQANYAASGGYYISCNADAIFTNSTTITGSIGIFLNLFTAEQLMSETLGLHVEEVTTHPLANFPNLYHHPNESEYAILQKMIDKGYDHFTGKVAAGRNMEMDYLLPLCGGRVWTGTDAVDNALADYEGNLSDAIAFAAGEAGLEEYRLYELPAQKTGIEKYLESFESIASGSWLKSNSLLEPLSNDPVMNDLLEVGSNPGIQAKLNPLFRNL